MIKKIQALKAKRGFTLVELIVVIAIIGVLAAILIPALSGVIENARKRSAENTCHSIQDMAKTYVSHYLARVGAYYTGADGEKVDMDNGNGAITLVEYIENNIPELKTTCGGNTKHQATIDIESGKVKGVQYQEGSFIAVWTEGGGLQTTKGTVSGNCFVQIGSVSAPAVSP